MPDCFEIALPVLPETANLQLADPSLVNFYSDLQNRTYWLNDEINNYTFHNYNNKNQADRYIVYLIEIKHQYG